MLETPTIGNAAYTSTAYGLGNMQAQNFVGTAALNILGGNPFNIANNQQKDDFVIKAIRAQQNKQETYMRRLVQVFIADTNENVPLEKTLLYSGEQKLTDATDQELFFEIDIKSILEAHNVERVKMVDKKVKERVEHIEPAKVRDLKMVVVDIAKF